MIRCGADLTVGRIEKESGLLVRTKRLRIKP